MSWLVENHSEFDAEFLALSEAVQDEILVLARAANRAIRFKTVMTGLDPVIHVLRRTEDVDGRVEPGHDDDRIRIERPWGGKGAG
jgi:hypothetical protein